ncbi:Kinesin-like protein [Drosera capensis]
MVKDAKSSRSMDQADEEMENVPLNPNDPPPCLPNLDASRAPLNSMPESTHNSRIDVAREVGGKSRVDIRTTPVKTKGKAPDSASLPLRTPEKQGNSVPARNRFGWFTSKEPRNEGKPHLAKYVSQTQFSRNAGSSVNSTTDVSRTTAMGAATSGFSESTSVQSTPTKSVSKPPNPGSRYTATGTSTRAAIYGAFSKGVSVTSATTALTATDVPHFDLKEDPSFWKDHNVQVIIRVRPLNSLEKSMHGYHRCVRQDSAQRITWTGQPDARFTFDHVACESMDQETLFRIAGLPMVENCLSGYNSCMFAYGQTGSGKTYTMLGEIGDLLFKPSPNRGMTPRTFEFLFDRIRAEEESRREEKLRYSCKCSFLEIYNEQITDLLDPLSTNLLLREDARKGVYVENLSEFEVHTVTDILRLLAQGSSNRRVAATNMNRESSRSHSVFTCIIESAWERDSTTNTRFARLNLVDLAGSERQKASGAEGERLKEAANINKSLSTLGHVIMVLVDVAHGKPRHVPYRDSRLTFLLQDSLGGNSKTMIIANISPSICCAAETLNTLKFAQRAKLIQNNAVVNEDSAANVVALQLQICLLQEELMALKHQNVSRTLSFDPVLGDKVEDGSICSNKVPERSHPTSEQLKPLEAMLAGALRREHVAETSIKQLEVEIEQLTRLVHQREDDMRATRMMLKFREDKIQRMEALLGELLPVDAYLLDENSALSEEIQLLRAKVDRNPEVTRFALENIRLLDQLRKFQDFNEGERETLLAELSQMRDQVIHLLECSTEQIDHLKVLKPPQMDRSLIELAECRSKLTSCLETNAKLTREIDDLHALLNNRGHTGPIKVESTPDIPTLQARLLCTDGTRGNEGANQNPMKHADDLVNLELELDIVKIILKEERSCRIKMEETTSRLTRELELAHESASLIGKQYELVKEELKEAKTIIEALESTQLFSISQIEDLRSENARHMELLRKQDLEISELKVQLCFKESGITSLKNSDCFDSPLQSKLNMMKTSLDMAKKLNMWYQCDQANQLSTQDEMDEVRRQAEAETAEVIVCLQADLSTLEQQVQESEMKKKETENRLVVMEAELRELYDNINVMKRDNENLSEELKRKEKEITLLSKDWEMLGNEIETALLDGHEALIDASGHMSSIDGSLPQERRQISEQVGRMIKQLSEKDLFIGELNRCLEDASNQRNDTEHMLKSLKGAALAITESHQQEFCEKENDILNLKAELHAKASCITELEKRIELDRYQLKQASACATAAFVMVNRLSEVKSSHLEVSRAMDDQLREAIQMNKLKDMSLCHQAEIIEETEKEVLRLNAELTAIFSIKSELEKRIESDCYQINRTSTCATAAFLVVKRLCELNSFHLDASERIDLQLRETMKMNQEKDIHISQQAAAIEEAERRAQRGDEAEKEVLRLRSELNAKSLMQRRLKEQDEYDILGAKEKLVELKAGVSNMKSSMNDNKSPKFIMVCFSLSIWALMQLHNEANSPKAVCYSVPHLANDAHEPVDNNRSAYECEERNLQYKDTSEKDVTILLLRKEIESAIDSLKAVQLEVACLCAEKEKNYKSDKRARESMEMLKVQVLALEGSFVDFEKQCGTKMMNLNHKLLKTQQSAEETVTYWYQRKELLKSELNDAKIAMAQKMAEASCLLSRYKEVQDTMEEADMMINGLMMANEKMKLEIEDLKKNGAMLRIEKECLATETRRLQASGELKDQQYNLLEKQFDKDSSETRSLVEELEGFLPQVFQLASEESFASTIDNFRHMKLQFQKFTDLIWSWIEEIWSEIILKECAASVLQLCHMGALMEVVNELKGENRQFGCVLIESNSHASDLEDQNMKLKEQLDICTLATGKELADMEKSFDLISRKEDETERLSARLTIFEEKIRYLKLQEKFLLERSECMGSKLDVLMKDLDVTSAYSLRKQVELHKHNENLGCQAENLMINLFGKEVELLVLASEFNQVAQVKADMEIKQITWCRALEDLKKEFITLAIFVDLREDVLLNNEIEVADLLKEIDKMKMLVDRSKFVEEEKFRLENELEELKRENCMLLRNFHEEESKVELSANSVKKLNAENCELRGSIHDLESQVAQLKQDLDSKMEILNDLERSQTCISEELANNFRESQQYAIKVDVLQKENVFLKNELRFLMESKDEVLCLSTTNTVKCSNSIEVSDMRCETIFSLLDEKVMRLSDQIAQDACENVGILSRFMEELDTLCCIKDDILSQNFSLSAELLRKDEVVEGLLFDLRLLQESSASARDQQTEIEDLVASLESKDEQLAIRLHELSEAVAHGHTLETQLKETVDKVSTLEMNLSTTSQSLKLSTAENMELRSSIDQIAAQKVLIENELTEKRKVIDTLETELCAMEKNLDQVNNLNESLKSSLDEVTCERHQLHDQLLLMEKKLETALALAEQNEAMAVEAQQIAASRSTYAEEKEEEVHLLEISVQELDSTINVLENKVDILKGEVERHRLQTEELQIELHSLKDQLQNVNDADADIKRHLDEKENNLQDALKKIRNLENDLANKNTEVIAQCKAHISELNLHAEAQACEYKKKFKELEAMAEQAKAEGSASHGQTLSCSKLEKNATRSRGSSSPFKCIGLGLAQQLKFEKDEELSSDRLRVEELEALAASRQKEIFTLNARLAAAESMTHDVIRDLLGVKLDMSSSYMSLFNSQQAVKTAEKSQLDTVASQAREEEVNKLTKQLNELIEERKEWLEEIDNRQAELTAAHIMLEKLQQQDRLLTAENEILKMETAKHKQMELEFEGEEENNQLKVQNDELSVRLRRAEAILSRAREELARSRACRVRSPYVIFDEEQRLKAKLQECEDERLHLAQELLGLCTKILKAAGITNPVPEVNLSLAEEALEQLVRRVDALERELEDLNLKHKVAGERLRLSAIESRSVPLSPMKENSYQSPRKMSKPPYYFSAANR